MKILRSILLSSSTITKKIGVPTIMIYLLRLDQNRISDHFWRKKWRFWSKLVSLLSVDPSSIVYAYRERLILCTTQNPSKCEKSRLTMNFLVNTLCISYCFLLSPKSIKTVFRKIDQVRNNRMKNLLRNQWLYAYIICIRHKTYQCVKGELINHHYFNKCDILLFPQLAQPS